MDHALIRTWLQLPPGNWPPDHYTLLGLAPGESDPRRIEQRVQERIERVRKHQLTRPDEATEAMSRLAQALVCLTDRQAKKAYDRVLPPDGQLTGHLRFSWSSLDGEPLYAGRRRRLSLRLLLAAILAVAGAVAVAVTWHLASSGDLGALALNDADNRVRRYPEIARYGGFAGPVTSVALSPDGGWLLAGGDRVYLWKRTSDDAVGQQPEGLGRVRSVAFASDGRHFATGGEGNVWLWKTETSRVVRRFAGHTRVVTSLAFSSDGRRLLSGGTDGTVRLWHVEEREGVRFAGHKGRVTAVALARDGLRAFSVGTDHTLRTWDVGQGREVRHLPGPYPHFFSVAAFSPGGRYTLSSDGIRVWLLDREKARKARPLPVPKGRVTCLAVSEDGGLALAGREDGTVQAWYTVSGDEVGRCVGHEGPVDSIALSADGQLALTGGEDRTVRLWRVGE